VIGGQWFFALGGVILMLTGVLQAVVRPRRPGEHRLWNRGTVFAAFCVLMGAAAVLVGTGHWPFPLR
jgi:hypothetical protein